MPSPVALALPRSLRRFVACHSLPDRLEQRPRPPPPTRSRSRPPRASESRPAGRTAPAPAAAVRSLRRRARSPSAASNPPRRSDSAAVARQSDRPHPELLQFLERAGDVHFGRRSARAPARRPTPWRPRRRAAPHGGSAARRRAPPAASTRPQDRAEVVRILDAVEHDDEWSGRRRGFDQFAQAVVARPFDLRHDPLMHATVRRRRSIAASSARSTVTPCARARASASSMRRSPRGPTRTRLTRPLRSASRTGLMP